MVDQNNCVERRASVELFFFAYRAFTSRPDALLAERGLGRVHHRILYFIGRNPRIAINGLLAILGISKQALHAPLRQLVEMQLVVNDVAEHDRRIRQLTLTEAGVQLENELTAIQSRHLDAAFGAAGVGAEQGWHAVMQAVLEQSRAPG